MTNPIWNNINGYKTDAVFQLVNEYNNNKNLNKVNLCIGAYKTDNNEPYILSCVQKAKNILLNNNHEYSSISGNQNFINLSIKFIFGQDINMNNIIGVQTVSGTGACSLACNFLKKIGYDKKIYVSNPTWGNHIPIIRNSNLQYEIYRYYNKDTASIDLHGMLLDIKKADDESVILLHACAHNPSGIEPNQNEWNEILQVIKEKNHTVFFDNAYQGFASGDYNIDAYAIRLFTENKINMLVAHSYSKNFGLYGERTGVLCISNYDDITKNQKILSVLKSLIRSSYSNPPINGAKIVELILDNSNLFDLWKIECRTMANRIKTMRHLFKSKLEVNSNYDWSFITKQNGMFCLTKLTKEQRMSIIYIY